MGTTKYETNISYKYYWESLNDERSYISFLNQVREIYATNPKTVLEIGVGNKLVYNHLKEIGIDVVSLDINKNVNPDCVGDVRKLPIKDGFFDTVCAFEVLEHIPFEYFEKALLELKRVSKKNVVISIPILKTGFEVYMWLPKIHYLYFYFELPLLLKNKGVKDDDTAHYWDVNRIGFSKKKMLKIISKHFVIKKEFRPRLNKAHWFLVLENK